MEVNPSKDETLEALRKLSSALYSVQRLSNNIPTLSIFWIQLQHPIYPIQQKVIEEFNLLNPGSGSTTFSIIKNISEQLKELLTDVIRFGICFKYVLALTERIIQVKKKMHKKGSILKQNKFDLIAKTFCHTSMPPVDSDFYYGDMPKKLQDSNINTLLISGNSKEADYNKFNEGQFVTEGTKRIPETYLIPTWSPLWIFIQQAFTSLKLRVLSFFQKDPLVRKLTLLAAQGILSDRVIKNAVFYWIGKTTGKIWNPKAFMTLYEGRSHERCLWRGIKSSSPDCHIIGFQHSTLFPYMVSMTNPESDCNPYATPETVLALGEPSIEMMSKGDQKSDTKFISFGTFRRQDKPVNVKTPEPARKTVLVVPQGFTDEMVDVFNFSCKLAELLPDHKFIFRCHPSVPFESVLPKLDKSTDIITNIEISKAADISEDINKSSVSIYQGSSAAIFMAEDGLKPIFLKLASPYIMPPMDNSGSWYEIATSPEDAAALLNRYSLESPAEAFNQCKAAVEEINKCYLPVNDSSINRLIDIIK